MPEVRALPPLPSRPREAHKGICGTVLLVVGSPPYTGAAALAAEAAVRGGAGLVLVAVPESIHAIVATKVLGPIVHALPATRTGTLAARALRPLLALAAEADILAVGPGLTAAPETARLVRALVARTRLPLVLDADGLNAFAGRARELARRAAPTILTPHPGELSRLTGRPVVRGDAARLAAARALALELRLVVLLKGHRTVVTDGARWTINQTGNPGMATGGTGDVLTGLVAALLGQGLAPFDAARLGAHLHGLAGDLAARELGEPALAPGDLLRYLPGALRRHAGAARRRTARPGRPG